MKLKWNTLNKYFLPTQTANNKIIKAYNVEIPLCLERTSLFVDWLIKLTSSSLLPISFCYWNIMQKLNRSKKLRAYIRARLVEWVHKPLVLFAKCFPKFIKSEWTGWLAYELQHLPIRTRLQAMTCNRGWLAYPCNGSHTQSINIKHKPRAFWTQCYSACKWVSHNAIFWKFQKQWVNDSIYVFKWVFLEIPIKICFVWMFLTCLIVTVVRGDNLR